MTTNSAVSWNSWNCRWQQISKWNRFKLGASFFFRGWSFWRDKRPASVHWDGALSAVTVALWYITASAVPFSSHPDKVMIIPMYCTVQDQMPKEQPRTFAKETGIEFVISRDTTLTYVDHTWARICMTFMMFLRFVIFACILVVCK